MNPIASAVFSLAFGFVFLFLIALPGLLLFGSTIPLNQGKGKLELPKLADEPLQQIEQASQHGSGPALSGRKAARRGRAGCLPNRRSRGAGGGGWGEISPIKSPGGPRAQIPRALD